MNYHKIAILTAAFLVSATASQAKPQSNANSDADTASIKAAAVPAKLSPLDTTTPLATKKQQFSDEQLKEWNKPITGFHPIKRVLRPIWKLRQEVVDLQENMNAFRRPIDELEPSFLRMEGKISGVETQMISTQQQLSGINSNLGRVAIDLSKLHGLSENLSFVDRDLKGVIGLHNDIRELSKIRGEVSGMRVQMKELQKPLRELHEPLIAIAKPLQEVNDSVSGVSAQIESVHNVVGQMHEQLKKLSRQLETLQQPVKGVSAPLAELNSEVKELTNLLRITLLIAVALIVTALLACITGIALIYRMRHNIFPLTIDRRLVSKHLNVDRGSSNTEDDKLAGTYRK